MRYLPAPSRQSYDKVRCKRVRTHFVRAAIVVVSVSFASWVATAVKLLVTVAKRQRVYL